MLHTTVLALGRPKNEVSLRQDFQGMLDLSKGPLSNKENSFVFVFASLFGGCSFLECDALQAALQLTIPPSPRIADMSSQETLRHISQNISLHLPLSCKWL